MDLGNYDIDQDLHVASAAGMWSSMIFGFAKCTPKAKLGGAVPITVSRVVSSASYVNARLVGTATWEN